MSSTCSFPRRSALVLLGLALALGAVRAWANDAVPECLRVKDLTPVQALATPVHAPITLVRDGVAAAKVYVADPAPSANLDRLVKELVTVVKLSSGADLEVVRELPPADMPTIVIGDCDAARAAGIDAAKIPIEGFVVKTAPNRVFLAGSTQPLPPGSDRWSTWTNDGTAWAVADFLERFVGVRWYWPAELGGRSITPGATLAIPPIHYSDQPVFRQRQFFPNYGWKLPQQARWFDKEPLPFAPGAIPDGVAEVAMPTYLPLVRNGNSWPYLIKVHEPQNLWHGHSGEWLEAHKVMFAVKADGSRNFSMFCYSALETFAFVVDGCERVWSKGGEGGGASWVTATCVTVSPADAALDCYCPACRETMAKGGASLVMGLFVKRMCEEVKKRWPDKKVIYLPYWNYQKCPDSVQFPDNLTVMVCTTGAPMALMRQKDGRRATEDNLHAWSAKVGGPITDWDYSDRGSGWTYGPLQYPHVVRDFYRTNRTCLAGSFLNGGIMSDWTTTAPTLYVWMKVLWNPDVEVDAVLDEMCRRLYGKAGGTVRELIRLECERWEVVPWTRHLEDAGAIPPPLFQELWPAEVVGRMQALRDKALAELADDTGARQRFLYWTWTFDAFLKDAEATRAPSATPK
jgi:hypothetical protein